ncbi:acetyltransferase (GNAT) family protein [Isoptericola jiangsuensis]|uniref:Acetyltransferase (GNAT) family protein n=1 Tax=Isoptericola jiangsuensis TaxID=548579 RepID=A0A2A9EVX7_9MICO|nr:GNAT family N-acetyltransferase [Isoptericola jiangsuensis]PFG43184.1 acetyltransferase (GNAT) family protein [Isoptericola jiangsuensis]
MTAMTDLEIRPYRPGDRAAVAEVCVRTAAGGGDARGLYSDDSLMPDVYALPYVDHSPDLAFVVVEPGAAADDDPLRVDDGRMLGYIIAVADTAGFADWWETSWSPLFRERHPQARPSSGPTPGYSEAALVRDGTDPGRMVRGLRGGELETHPAHLHIDLVPDAQGRGLGRRLMDTLLGALAEQGVPGVHLGYDPKNVAARAFYDRLGFSELPSHRAEAPLLGLATR